MGLFRRLAVFGALTLFACGDEEEITYVDEEVTIAEYSFAPDDDQTDPDGTLHRRGTATIFPDGKTDPNFPKDGIIFDAVIVPANVDGESSVTMTDTYHDVTRVFFVSGIDRAKFGMRDGEGGSELLFTREPDGTFTAAGVTVKDKVEGTEVARQHELFRSTPHEVLLLTYAVVKDGFVDAAKRGSPVCNPPGGAQVNDRVETSTPEAGYTPEGLSGGLSR